MRKMKGNFAADLYEVEAVPAGAGGVPESERFVYKRPPDDRDGEFEALTLLGGELSPWLPDGLRLYPDPPRAILSKYAGETLQSRLAAAGTAEDRLAWYERVLHSLAGLHLTALPHAQIWVREGRAKPYRFSREWAERMVREAETALPPDVVAELRRIVDGFYGTYSREAMRGPETFTHGDPHPGNVLIDGGRLTLVDWEWTNVASPMRDAAIAVIEEPSDELYLRAGRMHADLLLAGGMSARREDLMNDFYLMAADNALMMLGWDVRLRLRGDLSDAELRNAAERRLARASMCWSLASG